MRGAGVTRRETSGVSPSDVDAGRGDDESSDSGVSMAMPAAPGFDAGRVDSPVRGGGAGRRAAGGAGSDAGARQRAQAGMTGGTVREPITPGHWWGGDTSADLDAGGYQFCSNSTCLCTCGYTAFNLVRTADVIIAIDGATTLASDVAALRDHMGGLVTALRDAGLDYHLVVLADQDPALPSSFDHSTTSYLHIPTHVDSNNALRAVIDEYPRYQPFLRFDADFRHIIVVAGADTKLQALDLLMELRQLLLSTSFSLHAIASDGVMGEACAGPCDRSATCGATEPSLQYFSLAKLTNGLHLSICTTDWSAALAKLGSTIIERSQIPCDFDRSETPSVYIINDSFMRVPVKKTESAATCGSELAWYYELGPTSLRSGHLCPNACEALRKFGGYESEVDNAPCCTPSPADPR